MAGGAHAAEPPSGQGLNVVPVPLVGDQGDQQLHRDPGPAGGGPGRLQPVGLVHRYVPPVGVLGHQGHRLRSGAPDHDGQPPEGRGQLTGAVDREVGPLVVDRLTGPEPPQQRQRLGQALHPLGGRGGGEPEGGQLPRRRPRPDAQFEPPARQMVEGHGLTGQHRRVAKGVAQHQLAEPEPFGHRRQPGDRGQSLVHGLVGRPGGNMWSITASPVKPAASAASARARSASGERRICGMKRWNSMSNVRPSGTGQTRSTSMSDSRLHWWPVPPANTSFCLARLNRKWASFDQVKPTPPWTWMLSPVTFTAASEA